MRTYAIVLGALLAVYVLFVLLSTLKGRRHFFIRRKTNKILRALRLIFPCLITVGWLMVFYTGTFFSGWVPATRLPFGFGTLSLIVCTWGIVLLVTGIFPKKSKVLQEGLENGISN
jgi:TRAP-type C4-dicarboxylate transport system permease small subunit